MATEHHIVCGGIATPGHLGGAKKLALNLWEDRRGGTGAFNFVLYERVAKRKDATYRNYGQNIA